MGNYKSKYKIAVAIPNYNTPKHLLDECFQSIIKQSMIDDLIVIMVDDGSCNTSYNDLMDIISKYNKKVDIYYERRDERFGPAIVRQRCLDIIYEKFNCEYVTFLDSDDEFIGENNLEKLYIETLRFKCKFSFGNSVKYKNGHIEHYKFIKNPPYIMAPLHGCLYNIDFLRENNIKFPNYKNSGCEDSLFNMKCDIFCRAVAFNIDVYKWKNRKDSNYTIVTSTNLEYNIFMAQETMFCKYLLEIQDYDVDRVFMYINLFLNQYKSEISHKTCRAVMGYCTSLLYKKYLNENSRQFLKKCDVDRSLLSSQYLGVLSRKKYDLSEKFVMIYEGRIYTVDCSSIFPYLKNMIACKVSNPNVNGLDESLLDY